MKIEVDNGGLSLVKSDSLLIYENNDVILTFDEQYVLIFKFSEDSTIKEYKIDFKPTESGAEFNLVNFNNPLGIAIGKPVPFAHAYDQTIYISFLVYSVGKSKCLHYNIYLGK